MKSDRMAGFGHEGIKNEGMRNGTEQGIPFRRGLHIGSSALGMGVCETLVIYFRPSLPMVYSSAGVFTSICLHRGWVPVSPR